MVGGTGVGLHLLPALRRGAASVDDAVSAEIRNLDGLLREALDGELPLERLVQRSRTATRPHLDRWGNAVTARLDRSGEQPVLRLLSRGPDGALQSDPHRGAPRGDDILVLSR